MTQQESVFLVFFVRAHPYSPWSKEVLTTIHPDRRGRKILATVHARSIQNIRQHAEQFVQRGDALKGLLQAVLGHGLHALLYRQFLEE